MKKKGLLFGIIFILLVAFTTKVEAKYTCEYSGDGITVKYKVDSTYGPEEADVGGNCGSGCDEDILNWNKKVFGIDWNAQPYQIAQKCPEYAIFSVIDGGGFLWANANELYVSDEEHLDEYIEAIKETGQESGFPKIAKLIKQNETDDSEVKEQPTSCTQFPKSASKSASECVNSTEASCYSCENNPYFACLWIETKNGNGYCNVDNLQYIRCGDAFDIPKEAPALLSMAVNLLKIAVPIILIVISVITLLKALVASKEDEIKKAQSSLVKKLIISVLVFFVISIVQFVILKVADDNEVGQLDDCLSCLLNNNCQDSLYYKNNENGINRCYYVNGGEFSCFDE